MWCAALYGEFFDLDTHIEIFIATRSLSLCSSMLFRKTIDWTSNYFFGSFIIEEESPLHELLKILLGGRGISKDLNEILDLQKKGRVRLRLKIGPF